MYVFPASTHAGVWIGEQSACDLPHRQSFPRLELHSRPHHLTPRSDSSRPTSPTSSSAPPQRHVSGSLKDRIAKFENLGGGSSASAPIPRQFGAQGSYARGGLVGNRLPSLDPKTAGLPNTGPRRVSERRDFIGNRVPSTGNANAAAALAPRHTGGSAGSAGSTSTPAAASTSALGLGRPGAPKPDEEPPRSEPSASPTGSVKGSEPASTAGSVSAASSSVVSGPGSAHSGSAPTSATSSPGTSPGGALPPQLLVSSLPGQDDAGAMTPLSTRAEAGEEAPSELSMPTTPVANNPDLPPPGYDLVPGNLALAAGPTSLAMAPSPSISSSLVSQYDPKSEGEESANLKDVSNVSTPTGTPRQAHKTLEDDVSIAGSVAGSARGERSGPDDVEDKMSALSVDDKVGDSAEDEIAPTAPGSTEVTEPTPTKEGSVEAAKPSAINVDAEITSPALGLDTPTPTAPEIANEEKLDAAPKEDTATTPTAEESAKGKSEEADIPPSPVATAAFGAAAAVGAAAVAAVTLPVAAATTLLENESDAPPLEREVNEETSGSAKGAAAAEARDTKDFGDGPSETIASPVAEKTADAADDIPAEPKVEAAELKGIDTEPMAPTETPKEPPIPDVEELADTDDLLDLPKPDNSSEVTAIVRHVEAAEHDVSTSPSEPSFRSVFAAGGRDRDITPLASQLNSLSADDHTPLDREATPVPEHPDHTVDPSQPPPALDDDSDIVSVLGGTMSERGDDLQSNRSSMPPARASSELEFRYEDLHERFFRDSQGKADGSPVAEDTPTPSTFVAPVRFDHDGQGPGTSQASSQTTSAPDGGVTTAATAAGTAGSAAVAGSSLAAATHSFRENANSTSSPVVDASSTAGGVVNGAVFPSVPSTELDSRRPVHVHIEPSPHGILSQPAVNIQAPSPLGSTFQNGSQSKLSTSSASSNETSRVPSPAAPSFPSAPGNDIPNPETPSRTSTPSISAMTPGGVTPGLLHSFPPVPDEEHPYVEVHMSHHTQHGVPFPRSASDRSGLGLARITSQSLLPTPKRTSSLRAPLTPPARAAPFAMDRASSPTPGSSPSPNLSIESYCDRPPGSRSPGRKRNSFTPRSPHLDDEDPGDFEPGEGWAIVNRWESWRSPSQNSM